MHNPYSKAFRTVRLIKDIPLGQAASDLDVDERTLRDIESGKTDIISPRFDQLLKYYSIPHQVIFDLAADQSKFQNVIHKAKSETVQINQGAAAASSEQTTQDKLVSSLEKQIEQLQSQVQHLERNDFFQKELIARLVQNTKSPRIFIEHNSAHISIQYKQPSPSC